jgi:hypothetical protein
MEAIRSSETSVQSTTSTRRHTPEDGIIQKHVWSYNIKLDFRKTGGERESLDWIRFNDLIKVIMKNRPTLLCDVELFSSVEIHCRFGGMYCLHIQDLRYDKQSKSKKEAVSWREDGSSRFLRNVGELVTDSTVSRSRFM